jgi:hypothetical protein
MRFTSFDQFFQIKLLFIIVHENLDHAARRDSICRIRLTARNKFRAKINAHKAR